MKTLQKYCQTVWLRLHSCKIWLPLSRPYWQLQIGYQVSCGQQTERGGDKHGLAFLPKDATHYGRNRAYAARPIAVSIMRGVRADTLTFCRRLQTITPPPNPPQPLICGHKRGFHDFRGYAEASNCSASQSITHTMSMSSLASLSALICAHTRILCISMETLLLVHYLLLILV